MNSIPRQNRGETPVRTLFEMRLIDGRLQLSAYPNRRSIFDPVFHTGNQYCHFLTLHSVVTFNCAHGNHRSEDPPIMFGKTLYSTTFKDVNFVPLQSATFCVQCELISNNSKPYCLACGSHALLGLSHVLGGSMRNQQTTHLITDVELNNLVHDLLSTVPDPELLGLADHSRLPS